jgi:hypothetical protein
MDPAREFAERTSRTIRAVGDGACLRILLFLSALKSSPLVIQSSYCNCTQRISFGFIILSLICPIPRIILIPLSVHSLDQRSFNSGESYPKPAGKGTFFFFFSPLQRTVGYFLYLAFHTSPFLIPATTAHTRARTTRPFLPTTHRLLRHRQQATATA